MQEPPIFMHVINQNPTFLFLEKNSQILGGDWNERKSVYRSIEKMDEVARH